MLTRLRAVMRRPFVGRQHEDGFTLIEVAVAMFLFMIVSFSILAGLILVKTVSTDAEARQTATNLASTAISRLRATTDINAVDSGTSTQTIAGHTFTLKTTAIWTATDDGATGQCTAGTGTLLGKSVKVQVSWASTNGHDASLEQDSMVSAAYPLSTPGLGAIMIQVTDASGNPFSAGAAPAVTVATPANGAVTPTQVPVATDSQGCAYVPNVTPGDYVVSIAASSAGNPYLDSNQHAATSTTVSVVKDAMATVVYQYDKAAAVTVNFGSNLTNKVLPDTLTASFVSSNVIYTSGATGVAGCSGTTYCLFPFRSGYTAVAGVLSGNLNTAPTCLSLDPAQWQAGTDASGTSYDVGVTPGPFSTDSGSSSTIDLPMGGVSVTGLSGLAASGTTLRVTAQQQTAGPSGTADPGCATAASNTYTFSGLSGDTATLALPYGSWKLTYASVTSSTTSGSRSCAETHTWSGYTPCDPTGLPTGATWTADTTCTSGTCTRPYSLTTTTTSAAQPLDANIQSPAAPSTLISGVVTLDPRPAGSAPSASPTDSPTATATSTPTDTPSGGATP